MTALLLLLASLSMAAPGADNELKTLNHPKAAKIAVAERERYANALEAIYARLVEASSAPEFTTWWKREHPPYEPFLEVLETRWGVAQMYDTGTAAEVQVFRHVFETYVTNDDERAFILAHEYRHFLARDSYPKKRDPWPMSASHHCEAYLAWLKEKRPKFHADWLKKAGRVADLMVKGGLPEKQRSFERDMAMKQACTASGAEDRKSFYAWTKELTQNFLAASREEEALADHWAWKLSEAAGFEPRRGAAVFTRMASKETPEAWAGFEMHYPASLRAEELKPYMSAKYHWLPPPGLQ